MYNNKIISGDSSHINVGVLITNGASDYEYAVREGALFRNTGATLLSIGKYHSVIYLWLFLCS